MRLVKQAKDAVERADNQDGVDLNTQAGSVVMGKSLPFEGRYNLVGSSQKPSFLQVQGHAGNGKFEATLFGTHRNAKLDPTLFSEHRVKVSHCEDESQAQYRVEQEPWKDREFCPGTLTVTENKLTGEITVEQQQAFPWQRNFEPAYPTHERTFASSGPTDSSDVGFYQEGLQLQQSILEEIAQVQAKDNQEEDLNPQVGWGILTGYGELKSDNWMISPGGQYRIPCEASLKLETGSERVQEYTRGFGEHAHLSYRRDGETEIFERRGCRKSLRVEIRPDGSRFQQEFVEAEFGKLDPQMFKTESTVTTDFLPRFLNKGIVSCMGITAGVAAAAYLLGGGVASFLAGAVTLVNAGVALREPEIDSVNLQNGVNRFHGSDSSQQMKRARKAIDMHKNIRAEMPATRENCLKFLNETSEGFNGHLAILADTYGPSLRPALVVLPKVTVYPVGAAENGLRVPDGSVIPYGNIRELALIKPHDGYP